MNTSEHLLFFFFWLAIAFIVVRFAAAAIFRDKWRSEIVAAIAVLGFLVGFFGRSPTPSRPNAAVAAPLSVIPLAALVPTLNARMPDESAPLCARVIRVEPVANEGFLDQAFMWASPNAPHSRGGVFYDFVQGWAKDRSALKPAKAVCLVVDGKPVAGARTYIGIPRPDVARAFHNMALLHSGFLIRIPWNSLPPGWHTIQAAAVSNDGTVTMLNGSKLVQDALASQ